MHKIYKLLIKLLGNSVKMMKKNLIIHQEEEREEYQRKKGVKRKIEGKK